MVPGRPLSYGVSNAIYNGNKGTARINARPRLTRGGYTW